MITSVISSAYSCCCCLLWDVTTSYWNDPSVGGSSVFSAILISLVTLKKWELNRLNGVKDVTIDVVCSVLVDRITDDPALSSGFSVVNLEISSVCWLSGFSGSLIFSVDDKWLIKIVGRSSSVPPLCLNSGLDGRNEVLAKTNWPVWDFSALLYFTVWFELIFSSLSGSCSSFPAAPVAWDSESFAWVWSPRPIKLSVSPPGIWVSFYILEICSHNLWQLDSLHNHWSMNFNLKSFEIIDPINFDKPSVACPIIWSLGQAQ